MRDRSLLGALLLIGALVPITSCNNSPSLTSIVVSPNVMNFGGAGLTTQLTATGYYTHPGHAAITKDITKQVTWASSTVDCVTVSDTGLITSGQNICSNILVSASASGFHGTITGTMTVNVTQPTGGGGGGGTGNTDVTSLSIIPTTQSVAGPGDTAQFIAVGTTSGGATVNVTNIAAWTSSSLQIAAVNASGLVTAVSKGTATITAVYTNGDGTVATGTATFIVLSGGSSAEQITSLSIIPGSQSLSASGQTGQFIALGVSGNTGLTENITSAPQLSWSSSIPTIATISSAGLAQGVSVGSTTITALWTNTDGSVVSATATLSVTSTPAPEPLLSLSIIPGSITVGNLQDTGNFLAVGTFSTAPFVRDLTNSVTWLSSAPEVFPVVTGNNSTANQGAPAGTVTAYGAGTATIIAEATDPTTGSIQTATASFTCPIPANPPQPGQCYQGSQAPSLLATLTVYNEGLNTTNWEVTAPSATGTPNVIHCGPGWTANGGTGGSVCVATYPVGTTVTLTAPSTGAQFGGWSSSCGTTNPNPPTAAGPNTCTVTISGTNTNISIGAIFN